MPTRKETPTLKFSEFYVSVLEFNDGISQEDAEKFWNAQLDLALELPRRVQLARELTSLAFETIIDLFVVERLFYAKNKIIVGKADILQWSRKSKKNLQRKGDKFNPLRDAAA